jgi:5'-3' exonuclease
MKRFTLIIDGHNFFFRSLWSTFKQGKSKILVNQKEIDTYEKKLMSDFCMLIKSVGSIVNDVVFVKDSHSWRKDLLLQQEYKGNRKKAQDNIDNNGFTTVINNFTDTLNELGVKISQVYRSEGDDLISAWSDYLFQEGKSSLILSTDKDLTQLVKCVNDVHIMQYSPIANKLYISEETNQVINDMKNKTITQENLFDEIFTISVESDSFEKFVESAEIEIVNPEHVRFTKIVGGDTSDNIYPVYFKMGDGTTRNKGIGAKTVEKIYEAFKHRLGCEFDYHIYSNEDAMKMLCNIIYDIAKIKDENFTRRMLFENLKTNTSLVSLTTESIPEDVIEGMHSSILEESDKKQIVLSKITRENMFAKSRFKDYKSSIQIRSNILKGVKDDGDMSFIKD